MEILFNRRPIRRVSTAQYNQICAIAGRSRVSFEGRYYPSPDTPLAPFLTAALPSGDFDLHCNLICVFRTFLRGFLRFVENGVGIPDPSFSASERNVRLSLKIDYSNPPRKGQIFLFC